MKKKLKLAALAAILLFAGYYLYSNAAGGGELAKEKAALRSIAESLNKGSISRVDIFYMPMYIESAKRMEPEDIFSAPVALSVKSGTAEANKLFKAIKNTRLTTIGYGLDMREGFIVYDTANKEIGRVIMSSAKDGYLNGLPCHFKGPLKRTLMSLAAPNRYKGKDWKQKILLFLLEL